MPFVIWEVVVERWAGVNKTMTSVPSVWAPWVSKLIFMLISHPLFITPDEGSKVKVAAKSAEGDNINNPKLQIKPIKDLNNFFILPRK